MKKVLLNLVILFTLSTLSFSCKKACDQIVGAQNIVINYVPAVYINSSIHIPYGYSLIGMYSIVNASYPMSVRIQTVGGSNTTIAYSTDGQIWYNLSVNGNSFLINSFSSNIYIARSFYGNSGYLYIQSVNNYSVNQVNAGF